MSYVDKQLNAGEKVVFRTTLHPIVFVAAGAFSLVSVALVLLLSDGATALVIFLMILLALLAGGYAAIMYVTSEFAVTTSRVIIKVGWLTRRTIELQLSKVEGIVVEQGIIGRIFDFGTLVVGGTGGTKEPFALIRAPFVFRKQVQQQIDAINAEQTVAKNADNRVPDPSTREERECPHCAERILVRATRCRFCGQSAQPLS
jgi:uncharacterized membrane protein YdbT with pleckstrin-like domain